MAKVTYLTDDERKAYKKKQKEIRERKKSGTSSQQAKKENEELNKLLKDIEKKRVEKSNEEYNSLLNKMGGLFGDPKNLSLDEQKRLRELSESKFKDTALGKAGAALKRGYDTAKGLAQDAVTATPEKTDLMSNYSPEIQQQLDDFFSNRISQSERMLQNLEQRSQRSPMENLYGSDMTNLLAGLAPQYAQAMTGPKPYFPSFGEQPQQQLSMLGPMLGMLAMNPQVQSGAQNFYQNTAPQGLQDVISNLTGRVSGLFSPRSQ